MFHNEIRAKDGTKLNENKEEKIVTKLKNVT